MKIVLIILGYLKWHYRKAILSLSQVWINFLYFVWEFFSIRLLFLNFFDPWKRMTDSYPKSFNIKKYFYAFLTNLIVRIVGMVMRLFLIIVGLFCYILLAVLYPFIIIIWIFLPFIVVFLISSGILLIIK